MAIPLKPQHLNLWLARVFLLASFILAQIGLSAVAYSQDEWAIFDYGLCMVSIGVCLYFHAFMTIVYEDAYLRKLPTDWRPD